MSVERGNMSIRRCLCGIPTHGSMHLVEHKNPTPMDDFTPSGVTACPFYPCLVLRPKWAHATGITTGTHCTYFATVGKFIICPETLGFVSVFAKKLLVWLLFSWFLCQSRWSMNLRTKATQTLTSVSELHTKKFPSSLNTKWLYQINWLISDAESAGDVHLWQKNNFVFEITPLHFFVRHVATWKHLSRSPQNSCLEKWCLRQSVLSNVSFHKGRWDVCKWGNISWQKALWNRRRARVWSVYQREDLADLYLAVNACVCGTFKR